MATLVPIVKDKLGDICSSKNYRSIAISSLVLKLIDWIIIDKYGHLLHTNEFQFGFQSSSSTSLCSWLVFETIDHYLRNGSVVYGCLLDCTKAFDTIEHSILFEKLLNAGLPPIILRILIYIYRNQTAIVQWNGTYSSEFPIRNGVRQGAVISPLFFSFYMDNLFDSLSKSGSGCHIASYYSGCFGYADDLFLISPSRKGLQDMLNIAEDYVQRHNISFSTNPVVSKGKTKAIIFTRRKLRFTPVPLELNGNLLPWVEDAKYLGNFIENVPTGLSMDVLRKRAMYIEKNMELMQEFPFAHPELKCRINRIYNSAFPGSVLYDFASDAVKQLENSWSVSVRKMWELPMQAHRFLIEPLSGVHAHVMVIIRFIKFLQGMLKSDKRAVHVMLRKVVQNASSTTGKNLRLVQDLIGEKCDLLTVSPNWLKKKLSFKQIPDHEVWRVNLIKEVTDIRHDVLYLQSEEETETFLNHEQLKDYC